MATLGQRLREERENRGLTIEQLAAQTRINAQYFAAIEADDIASLPGGFFYRSFLRQYARLLELPESVYQPDIQRSLDGEMQTLAHQDTALPEKNIVVPRMPTGRVDPAEETRRWLVRIGVLVLVLAIATAAFIAWDRWKNAPPAAQEQAPPFHAAPEPVKPAPQKQPESQASAQQPATQDSATLPPAQTEAAQTPAPQAPASPSGPVRVIVRATDMTWVGVWQGSKVLFGDVLRAGETRGFGAEDKLRLRLGNAGGVEIEWNGKLIPSAGPRGQVRTLDFWADGYALVQPPPAAAPSTPPQQQP